MRETVKYMIICMVQYVGITFCCQILPEADKNL